MTLSVRSLAVVLPSLFLLGAALSAEPLLENGDFSPAPAAGAPPEWAQPVKGQPLQTLSEEGARFVRIEVTEPGADNYIQQIVKLPPGTMAVALAGRFRYAGIEQGAKGHMKGKVTARYLAAGKETGGWINLADVLGSSEGWLDKKTSASVPPGADSIMVRLGFYGVKAGRLDVARIDATALGEADLQTERGQYRPAQPYGEPVSEARVARLARGVNLNNWFGQPYSVKVRGRKGSFEAAHFRGFIVEDDLVKLKAAGLTHVRLPVEPEIFMDATTGALRSEHLGELDRALALLVQHGLAVQVDAHPKMPRLKALRTKPDVAEAFVAWWAEFARHLAKTTDPEWVFLEPMNEPGGQSYYGDEWAAYQDRLITVLRQHAPRHTLIGNAGGYQLVKEQVVHLPHPDRNVIYAVHFYEPSQFTHQGAIWMKDWYRPLRQVPWPVDASSLPQAFSNLDRTGKNAPIASKTEKVLQDMAHQGLGTVENIAKNFDKLAEWSQRHERRLIINEFGVYKPHAPPAGRLAWLEQVRQAAEARGFGWSLWEYAEAFGFAEGEPGERQFDPAALQALGLKPAIVSKPTH